MAAAGFLPAQQAKEPEGARELFYIAAARKDILPPMRKAAPAGAGAGAAAGGAPASVAHLGLRYNLALVDSADRLRPVDSDQIFRKGQCLAIQIETNRSAYVYVLARQIRGDWQPLLPSREMPGESNILNPGEKTRVPKQHCFEITDPPGTESLFVVLSRDPADVYELNEGIKGGTPAAQNPTLLASAQVVNNEVERFSRALKADDFVKRKVARPLTAAEPPNSTYVVNRSNRPASRVVTEIRIRHQ